MLKNNPNKDKIIELRTKTGHGIMDCMKALALNNNDVDKAIEWIRRLPRDDKKYYFRRNDIS